MGNFVEHVASFFETVGLRVESDEFGTEEVVGRDRVEKETSMELFGLKMEAVVSEELYEMTVRAMEKVLAGSLDMAVDDCDCLNV